jgi:hypothetical protein
MVVDAAIFRAENRPSKTTYFILAFRKPADDMSQHEVVAHDPREARQIRERGRGRGYGAAFNP